MTSSKGRESRKEALGPLRWKPLLGCGESDRNFCSRTHLTLYRQLTSVGFDDPVGDGKSQPHSFFLCGVLIVEDLLHLIRWDARSSI
jgi:hypothetical protein